MHNMCSDVISWHNGAILLIRYARPDIITLVNIHGVRRSSWDVVTYTEEKRKTKKKKKNNASPYKVPFFVLKSLSF